MANPQSGVFYPPNVIFYILPFRYALNLFIILHIFAGGTFLFLLIRQMGYALTEATVGAVLFMFGGITVSLINLLTVLQSYIWIPLIFICWLNFIEKGKVRYISYCAFFATIQFLGGAPVVCIITLGMLLFYGKIKSKMSFLKYFSASSILAILTFLLSSLQLLPMAQFVSNSSRMAGPRSFFCSFNPHTLLNLVIPRVYFPKEGASFLMTPFFESEIPWILGIYIGPFVLILTILSLFDKKERKESLFWWSVTIVCTVLAFGKYFTPSGFLLTSGVMKAAFSISEKFLLGTFFSLVVLFAKGFKIFSENKNRQKLVFYSLSASFLALVMVKFFVATDWLPPGRYFVPDDYELRYSLFQGRLSLEAVIVLLYTLLCFLLFSERAGKKIILYLITALLFVEMAVFNMAINPTVPFSFYEKPSKVSEFLSKQKDIFRVQSGFEFTGKGKQLDIPENIPPLRRYGLYQKSLVPMANMEYGVHSFYGAEAISLKAPLAYLGMIDKSESSAKVDLMKKVNIKYLVTADNLNIANMSKVAEFDDFKIYELANTTPRVFIENKSETEGKSEIVSYHGNSVELEVTMGSDGNLVLLDTYYPGWQVLVDGIKKDILITRDFFRKVELKKGTHHVKFYYKERLFLSGLIMSLIGCFIALLPFFSVKTDDILL